MKFRSIEGKTEYSLMSANNWTHLVYFLKWMKMGPTAWPAQAVGPTCIHLGKNVASVSAWSRVPSTSSLNFVRAVAPKVTKTLVTGK